MFLLHRKKVPLSVDVPGAMKSRLFSRPPESVDEQGGREGEVPHPLDSMAEEALLGGEAGVVPLLPVFAASLMLCLHYKHWKV